MILYILGLLISFGAGAWVLFKGAENRKGLNLFLSGGGAFLVTILFTHVLPEVFEVIPEYAGLALLAGFLLQIVLENFSSGIEHGHAHVKSSRSAVIVAVIALCIHALIEGMPIASALLGDTEEHMRPFLVGVFMHKIPVAITLSLLLSRVNTSMTIKLVILAVFILCTVVGSLIQVFLTHSFHEIAEQLIFASLALTVGILLHVSTTILFESGEQHKLTGSKILSMIVGISIGLLLG